MRSAKDFCLNLDFSTDFHRSPYCQFPGKFRPAFAAMVYFDRRTGITKLIDNRSFFAATPTRLKTAALSQLTHHGV